MERRNIKNVEVDPRQSIDADHSRQNHITMPSQICLCSLVSAHVGPFPNDEGLRDTATCTGPDGVVRPRLQRRKRQRHAGIIIATVQERPWRVKWDQMREESEHTANELRLEGEASEAQKTAARVARLEQPVATPAARVEKQPTPTAGEQPMATTTIEATINNEATTTNEAATTDPSEEASKVTEFERVGVCGFDFNSIQHKDYIVILRTTKAFKSPLLRSRDDRCRCQCK
jgi:hypothetical protein